MVCYVLKYDYLVLKCCLCFNMFDGLLGIVICVCDVINVWKKINWLRKNRK